MWMKATRQDISILHSKHQFESTVTSHGTFLIFSKIGFPACQSYSDVGSPFYKLARIWMEVITCRVFTMMALNPGRNTRGVLSFVFDVSGRLAPASLDGVAG